MCLNVVAIITAKEKYYFNYGFISGHRDKFTVEGDFFKFCVEM
jgi:hypothetical protein